MGHVLTKLLGLFKSGPRGGSLGEQSSCAVVKLVVFGRIWSRINATEIAHVLVFPLLNELQPFLLDIFQFLSSTVKTKPLELNQRADSTSKN